MSNFIHLHCHSEYSIDNSTITIDGLISQAKSLNFDAIAVTDRANFFAAIKFYQAAIKAGIKPIFGVELSLKDKDGLLYQVLVLCKTYVSYERLCELISVGYLYHQHLGEVALPEELLAQNSQGLILIAISPNSDICRLLKNDQLDQARQKAKFWQQVFLGSYYFAISRIGSGEQELNTSILSIATQLQLPVVATNAVQFLTKDDFLPHDVRACIASGDLLDDDKRKQNYYVEQYLKSAKQMSNLFKDLPELCQNSIEIGKRCNVRFELYQKHHLPDFPIPSGIKIKDFLTQQAENGLKFRLAKASVDKQIYQKRLHYELDIIIKMDFTGYFLIVADFIAYAKNNGIPVGPGRGSGAGSLVAYALNITNVDPIKHGLLFERFLNPERISMPDFDIDFCTKGRDDVIAYVADKYGAEKVSQIVTHGTMAAKGVVRDVGRVLGHPYSFGDRLAKLIPNDLKITLSRALGRFEAGDSKEDRKNWFSTDLLAQYDSDPSVKTTLDLSLKLEGLARNIGTHAGGVVIAPSKISDFCPIYKGGNQKDSVVSQFDMNDLEAVGLVKFDFLGLSNLTVISNTVDVLAKQNITPDRLDIDNLPLDDNNVYELLSKGQTTGIFQLESEGIRSYLTALKPDSFDDIVAILALYRPGPLESGMVEDYIAVKHGSKTISYPHPMLEQLLNPTNGVFVYQEQVIQAAQIMAGYSLGDADILRRAMGKKDPKEMKKQRNVFIQGAVKKGVSERQATQIFQLIDKFSGYGFNKSHSVAYALISYQTAYLKAHYPAFFMAAVLSGMMDNSDRIAIIIVEINKMGIDVVAPDINLSNYEFIVQNNAIIYGLGAIKGVGAFLAENIVASRKYSTYSDLLDFCCRIDKGLLNRRVLEALILAGAFDKMVANRCELFNTFPLAVRQAERYHMDKASGQDCLFGDQLTTTSYADIAVKSRQWTPIKQLYEEKKVMGYFFSAHPTDFYKSFCEKVSISLPSNLKEINNRFVKTIGIVSNLRFRENSNSRSAMFNISDAKKSIFVILDIGTEQALTNLANDKLFYLSGILKESFKKDNWRLQAEEVLLLEDFIQNSISKITLKLSQHERKLFKPLTQLINNNIGKTQLEIHYQNQCGTGKLVKPITPSQTLIDEIKFLFNGSVNIDYRI